MDTTTICSAWVLLIFSWLAVLGWLGDKIETRRPVAVRRMSDGRHLRFDARRG